MRAAPSKETPSLRYSALALYFLLTLVATWAFWIPAAVAKLNGAASLGAPDGFWGGTIARWMPGLVAILLATLPAGRVGIKDLLAPVRTWRVNIAWYVFALFFQLAVFYAARWIDGLLGRQTEITSSLTAVYGAQQAAVMLPFIIISTLPGAFAEELGWRGFALPRLQARSNPILASLVIALVWGIWHIPLLVYYGQLEPADFAGMALNTVGFIPLVLVYTWLYNNTKGSLLLVTIFHAAQQIANNILGIWPTYTDDIITWLVGGIILIFMLREMASSRRSLRAAHQEA